MTGLRIEIKCHCFFVSFMVVILAVPVVAICLPPPPLKLFMVRERQQGTFRGLCEHRECVKDETNSFKSSLKFQKPCETEERMPCREEWSLSYQSAVTYPLPHQRWRWNPGLTAPLPRCVN